jgi:putative ABC transport system substrate-binding protein
VGNPHRRRALLAALLSAAACPHVLASERVRIQVVGCFASRDESAPLAKAMAELGYREGENLRLDARQHPASDAGSLGEAARALVATRPDVLVALWPYEISALLAATRTVPIVCGAIPDPISAGFAKSLRRPGGNVTGLSTGSHETWPIVIGMLRTLRPQLKQIAVLHSPHMPVEIQMRSHREAAEAAGIAWSHVAVSTPAEVERALAPLAGEAIHLAPITADGLAEHVLEVAHRHRILTFGGGRTTLIGYSRYFADETRRIAATVDRVLRGANPAEIPFELPDRTHFSLNRATARLIGVEIPAEMLLRADRVVD